MWRPILKRTFPNKKIKRAQVVENLEHVYQARNRLAHHEPVLHSRFHDTIAAVEFLSENLTVTVTSKVTPLAKLIANNLDQVKGETQQLHDRLASFRTS